MKRSIVIAALGVMSLSACSSGPSEGSVYVPNATIPTATSSQTGPTGLDTPSSSSTAAPTTSAPSVSTPAATQTSTPGSSASGSFTCHYEEGDAPCNAAEYQVNTTAWPQYQAGNHGSTTPGADVPRDANGFALGGPAYPAPPSPATPAGCRTYRSALIAWSNYQNQHRPAGSTNLLPMSADVQNLDYLCHLSYYG